MAHFRGTIHGNKGPASRLGNKNSGMRVEAQSWQGKVVVLLEHDERNGKDYAFITLEPHHGNGIRQELFNGLVDGTEVAK